MSVIGQGQGDYGFDRTGEGDSVSIVTEHMVEASGGDCHLCP